MTPMAEKATAVRASSEATPWCTAYDTTAVGNGSSAAVKRMARLTQ
jgi:hypothetical protein